MADYLIQHASQKRRYERVPATTWEAVLNHIRNPADTARLAASARNRLLYCYAISLYRNAANAGERDAASRLAGLLAQRGDLDGAVQVLRALAETGDGYVGCRLADLLVQRGDLTEAVRILRARAEAGDQEAARRLVDLLVQRGDLDRLRAPGRGRQWICRYAAGRSAGPARRPGRTARPGRGRRPGRRLAAGLPASPARRPGRVARPRRGRRWGCCPTANLRPGRPTDQTGPG
jgi:hypothetical protein